VQKARMLVTYAKSNKASKKAGKLVDDAKSKDVNNLCKE
jgi:hypothetical protein